MGARRKRALIRLEGLIEQAEKHVNKVLQNPGHSSARKHRHDAMTWILDMREALRHVGDKTAAEWEERLKALEAALAQRPEEKEEVDQESGDSGP
jgi:hypothetical protein